MAESRRIVTSLRVKQFMGIDFKPSRRKFGVATLAMACVFMGGWMRSFGATDVVTFHCGERATGILCSSDGYLFWGWRHDEMPHNWLSFPKWGVGRDVELFLLINDAITLVLNRTSFQSESHPETLPDIPYWSIVIPLTLISTYLLLLKPRKATIGPTHV